MRIEIGDGLEKALDTIKAKEASISYSRGHAETVRFLTNYYVHHKPLEQVLGEIKEASAGFIANIDQTTMASLERVFPKAIAHAVTNLLTYTQEPQPTRDPAAGQPRSGQ